MLKATTARVGEREAVIFVFSTNKNSINIDQTQQNRPSGEGLFCFCTGFTRMGHTNHILPVSYTHLKYGAAVVGLAIDERGIQPKAEDRVAIARRIKKAALEAGIPQEDIYIDCLTLTASAQQEDVYKRQVLDTARRAGICVLNTNLMTPRKSVTAILGLSDHPVKGHLAGCGHCVLRTRCEYRKRGKTCASE